MLGFINILLPITLPYRNMMGKRPAGFIHFGRFYMTFNDD